MTSTYVGERITVPDLHVLSVAERVDAATTHEVAALDVIDTAPERTSIDDSPVWPWKALMHREVVAHYARLGEEEAARRTIEKLPPYARNDIFVARLAILEAFDRSRDYEAVQVGVGTNPDVPEHSRQALKVVKYALGRGLTVGLDGYVAQIPRVTERTIGHIMLASDGETIVTLRDSYTFVSNPASGSDSSSPHFELNDGKARIHLAAAMHGAPELHTAAVNAVAELYRPDFARQEIEGYVRKLLAEGKRAEAEEMLSAVTRVKDPTHRISLLKVMAATTQTGEDIDRFRQAAQDVSDNKFLLVSYFGDLAKIYAERGEVDKVNILIWAMDRYERLYVGGSTASVQLDLLRAYLRTHKSGEATDAYSRATYSGNRSRFVAGRLMLARYLRTGDPGRVRLTF